MLFITSMSAILICRSKSLSFSRWHQLFCCVLSIFRFCTILRDFYVSTSGFYPFSFFSFDSSTALLNGFHHDGFPLTGSFSICLTLNSVPWPVPSKQLVSQLEEKRLVSSSLPRRLVSLLPPRVV